MLLNKIKKTKNRFRAYPPIRLSKHRGPPPYSRYMTPEFIRKTADFKKPLKVSIENKSGLTLIVASLFYLLCWALFFVVSLVTKDVLLRRAQHQNLNCVSMYDPMHVLSVITLRQF